MRTLIAVVTLAATLAVGATAAQATTGTGSAGGLTVTVSLLPDTAAVGAPFTVSETITNATAGLQFVRVTQTLQGPAGRTFSFSYAILLRAGRSFAFSFTFTLPPRVPAGIYTLKLAANAATATAQTTVGG